MHATADIEEGLEELSESLENFAASMQWITDFVSATNKVVSGIDTIIDNIDVDFNSSSEGLPLVSEGLGDIADGVLDLMDALGIAATIIGESNWIANAGKNVTGSLSDALLFMKQALGDMSTMMTKIKSLTDYLNSVKNIRIPYMNPYASSEADKLFLTMSNLEIEMTDLTSEISMFGSELSPIVREMNDCFSRMSDNIINMIYGITDTNIFDDEVTEDEVMEITYGKVFSSHNSAPVYGDINVGGICGAMGLEYTLDPEDDMSAELSVTQKKHYQLKAVIHACVNSGDVTSKRDAVGGVVGKMDFGTVYASESYCSVASETGNYVGGIAGISAGRISASFVKGYLSGAKYIGGIIGAGVTEDFSGDSSMVRDCYSMVEILSFTQYAGAIAGTAAGEFEANYFVSDILAGIDRVSYHGKAMPISYEELVKRRSIPGAFYSFTLKFIADGEIVKSLEFNYGDSFDASVFPEVPKKDGYYGYWDTDVLENLTFDVNVNAVYKPYVTAIGSENDRNGKNVFLVEGKFTSDDKLVVASGGDSPSPSLVDGIFTSYAVVERWTLSIPNDNNDIHDIHFLPEIEKCVIYIVKDGEWVETDVDKLGKYLTFSTVGSTVEIAVARKSIKIIPVVLVALVAIVIGLGVFVAVKFAKSKKPNQKKKTDPKNNQRKTTKK